MRHFRNVERCSLIISCLLFQVGSMQLFPIADLSKRLAAANAAATAAATADVAKSRVLLA
jgi:hypothetical protein